MYEEVPSSRCLDAVIGIASRCFVLLETRSHSKAALQLVVTLLIPPPVLGLV